MSRVGTKGLHTSIERLTRFSNGNPHPGRGYLSENLLTNLEYVRDVYGMAIFLGSGYRYPHGDFLR